MTDTASARPSWPDDAVEVGHVLDAYGVKGWIKVQPFSRDAQALFKARQWFLRRQATASRAGPKASAASAAMPAIPQALSITAVRDHGDVIVAQAAELLDRNAAEAVRGCSLFVSRSSFPPPTADEYYWVDLIGLDVVNLDGAALGRVQGLIDTGPHCVIRVVPEGVSAAGGHEPTREADESEVLIPFVNAYVQDVSFPERKIVVDWGLDY